MIAVSNSEQDFTANTRRVLSDLNLIHVKSTTFHFFNLNKQKLGRSIFLCNTQLVL